ncbi:hypothetical protein RHGRI_024802 [Rhododendron griersonianum]|uniref:Uncharacterized protein n=1 Tax=Rhododendron griersonianum TaxID=479676 RepID=A0AAV6J8J1_9ERIC|nr:hypothetical protein RHGRI_024802 [Rhododendron griersonianum]
MAEQNPLLSLAPKFSSLSLSHSTMGEDREALQASEQVLSESNQSIIEISVIFLCRAMARVGMKNYEGAIGDCLQAIKLDDSRWQPHYCMGLAYFHLKKYKDAKSALFKGADLAAGYRSWFDDLILNCNDADAELPVDAKAKEVVPPVNELLKMLAYTILPGINIV